jgi:hypothetical protein
MVNKEMSLSELTSALKTCNDSAPGNDGIQYSFYKQFWDIWGPIILNSWRHANLTGELSPSNKSSIITLLPKEGKDPKEIGNWRPITLTNCDLKIITKALAIRLSLVADKIIDNSQTAYIPGRSVMDNIRLIQDIIQDNSTVDRILVSLDAKKAFDSVSHSYIELVLDKYGFGDNFIRFF